MRIRCHREHVIAGTRAARSVIARALTKARNRTAYWLDLGNNAASGQFVLGQPLNSRNRRKAARLRTVSELYPEIIDAAAGEDPLPSCSAVEALDRQPFLQLRIVQSERMSNQIQAMFPRKLNGRLPKRFRQPGPMRMAAAELLKLALQLRNWFGKRRSSLVPHYQPSLAAHSK